MNQVLIKQCRMKRICMWIASMLLLIVLVIPVFASESNTGELSAEDSDSSGEAMSVENVPEEGIILPSVSGGRN